MSLWMASHTDAVLRFWCPSEHKERMLITFSELHLQQAGLHSAGTTYLTGHGS